eukprot:2869850-Prymnesium_polylepis.1
MTQSSGADCSASGGERCKRDPLRGKRDPHRGRDPLRALSTLRPARAPELTVELGGTAPRPLARQSKRHLESLQAPREASQVHPPRDLR